MSSDEQHVAPSGAAWGKSATGAPGSLSGADWDRADSARSSPAHPFAAAERSRYALGAELGVGGMGMVRSARDARLDRDVAYKHVAKHASQTKGVGERFVREARITAFLEHPAIVPIYDAGESADGEPFYTMRLVRGRSLGDAIDEAPDLSARLRLLRHFLDACEAVAYAHRQGVVHRDLKPDNVMVGEFGETQVVDWGLARWDADERPAGEGSMRWASVTDPSLSAFSTSPGPATSHHLPQDTADQPEAEATRVGSVVGTPAYMSPEQARGESADARSDVWSLGVMLWQLVDGAHPLADERTEEMLRAVRQAALPTLSSSCEAAPAELCAIVARAMAADPQQRYADAKALAEDVARYLDGRLVRAHLYSPAEQLRRILHTYRAPLSVAGVALLLLLIIGLLAARRTQVEHDRALSAERVAQVARTTADRHLAQALVQHAQAALQVDARAEAEIFAIESLSRAESPEARGVLAGFAVAPRPRLVDRTPMPRCIEVRPSPLGDAFLCVQAESLGLWRVTPTGLRRVWNRAMHVMDAAILAQSRQILVAYGKGGTARLQLADGGAVHKSGFYSALDGNFESATSTTSILAAVPGASFVLHPGRSTPVTFAPCAVADPLVASSLAHGADRVASACASGLLILTDAYTGEELRRATPAALGPQNHGITALAWMPGDQGLVVGGRDGSVAYLDVAQLRVVRSATLGLGETRELRPHPTRPMVAVMGERGGVLLWNPTTGAVHGRLPAGWSDTLRFSPDATELWCYGAELRRWRLPSDPRPLRFSSLPDQPGLSSAALSPDGQTITLMPGTGELNVVRVADGKVILKDRFQEQVLKGGAFGADGRTFMVYGVSDPSARVYDTDTWRPTRTYELGGCKRAYLLSNGWLVAANYGSILAAYGPTAGGGRAVIARRYYVDGAQTDSRARVFLLSQSGRVDRVDALSPPTLTPLVRDRSVRRIATDPEGKWLALARRRDLVIRASDLRGPETVISMGDGRVFDVALSRGARYAAVGNLRRTARVWRVADRTLVAVLRGHTQRVSHVSFNTTGAQLLTASWDGTARLWDMRVLSRPASALAAEVNADWGLSLQDALNTPFR